jgi:hypothetical protein
MKICVVSWVPDSGFSNPDPEIILMTFPDHMSNGDIIHKAGMFCKENFYIDNIQFLDDVNDLTQRAEMKGREWTDLLLSLFNIISHYRYENFNLSFSQRPFDEAQIG